jgi:aspartate kinase
MKVFKFGGASVKDADGVKNVAKVLNQVGYKDTVVIVSAMGKTTNALELVVDHYFNNTKQLSISILELKRFHLDIVDELLSSESMAIKAKVSELIEELKTFLKHNKATNYSFVYDQVVGFGELLSTHIINSYLNYVGIKSKWIDARKCVKTDSYYRDANLDWEQTQKEINEQISKDVVFISQGFIASDQNNFTTTLGREGSDYTAAIFAYVLNAESVTIWKDVPGVLNGDPRVFENTQLLNQISYAEAIELAFYGASVIHPKTLQPLQRKEIPLYVRSFINPEGAGTSVSKGKTLEPYIPCYILKPKQVLIRLSSLDFSFIVEDNISEIFALLYRHQMRVDLIQNSAISFSVCVNNKYNRLEELLKNLRSKFKVTVFENVDLHTVRHFDAKALASIENQKEKILLEQRAQETIQYVVER